MKNSDYQISDRALVRAPVRPTDFYPGRPADRSPLDGMRALWADEIFREAVRVASSVLADQVDALLSAPAGSTAGERDKRIQSLYRGVLKYAIRISTRTTPFGVFGGSAIVGFGEEPLVLGPNQEHRKHARVGFSYLKQLADSATAALGDGMRVVANPTAYVTGDRIAVMVNPQAADGKVNEKSNVRYTPPVRHVMGVARQPISLSAITASLNSAFPDAKSEVLVRFVNELVEHGLLISELTPSAFDTDPTARWMRAGLDGKGQISRQLRAARDSIATYRATALGRGIDELNAVYAALRTDVHAAQEQLQVDLSIAVSGQIPAGVAPRVEAAVSAMMRMSLLPARFPELQRHTERFADKFGRSLVPLHRMFDPVQGIGAPAGYPSSRHQPSEGMPADGEWLGAVRRLRAGLIDRARRTGANTVTITPGDLAAFPTPPGTPPPSYDAFFQLDGDGEEDIRIILSPIGLATPAGKAGGRFAYGDPDIEAHVRDLIGAEKAAQPDAILCELDYVSNRSRVNNVAVAPSVYDYQLKVTTGVFAAGDASPEQVAFADLLVGAEDGRFHLVHAPTGKPVAIRTANLVNPEIAADVVRFIQELALDGTIRPAWTWGDMELLMGFLPGVEVGGVTLSLPTWRVPVLSGDPDEQDEQLMEWAADAGLPSYVYVGTLDNRLLLHLRDRIHRDLLRKEVADGAECVSEAPEPSRMGIIRDCDGRRYASEAVLSAVARYPVPVEPPPTTPHFDTTVDAVRSLAPGTEWWYLRVYGDREKQNEILSRLAATYAELPDQWFYIRYADPDDHVRIRVRSAEGAFDQVREVIGECVRAGLAHRYHVDPYVRELERYGGPDVMPIAERIFCTESQLLASVKQLCLAPELAQAAHRLDGEEDLDGPLGQTLRDAAHLMDHYLAALELTSQETTELLELINTGYRSEFSTTSPALRKAIRPLIRRQPSDAALSAGPVLHDALVPDTQALLRALAKGGMPWHLRAMTLQSLLHMFANRMGLPRNREYQALFLLSVIKRSEAHKERTVRP